MVYLNYSNLFFNLDSNIIKEYAKRFDLTINTVFQGIIGITLYKLTNLLDFTFGITVSGITIDLDGIEDLIGLTINTLPLRVSINRNIALIDFFKMLHS